LKQLRTKPTDAEVREIVKAWLGQGNPARTFEIVQRLMHGDTTVAIGRAVGLPASQVGRIAKRFEERLGILLTGEAGKALPQGQ
jgi:hypothetical protein